MAEPVPNDPSPGENPQFPIASALQGRVWQHGVATLSDTELIALLIGTGCGKATVVDLAHTLLVKSGTGLMDLARRNPWELLAVEGMTRRKVCMVLAAMELARRKNEEPGRDRPAVTSSAMAFELLRPVIGDLLHEEFWLLLLDRGCRLIEKVKVSSGGQHGTVADPKMIFRMALERHSCNLVLAHNHPSGQCRPSAEDMSLTKKLVEGSRFLDIVVQDHVIVTQLGYYSFADNGQL